MSSKAPSANIVLSEALRDLAIAVTRSGKFSGPPPKRIAIVMDEKRASQLFGVEGSDDHLMLVGMQAFELIVAQLVKRRTEPGEGSFSFQEMMLNRPWYDITVELYVDAVMLWVSQVHSIAAA